MNVYSNGGFNYTAPAGIKGVDTFDYTVQDEDGQSFTTSVEILIDSMAWFVDNSATSGAQDGSLSDPFLTLPQARLASGPGDTIYAFQGGGAYTQGIYLQDRQTLLGEGVDFVHNGLLIVDGDPARRPSISPIGSSSVAINLAQENTVRGLNIVDSEGCGILGTGTATPFVSFTVEEMSITGAANRAILLDDGVANVSIDAITNNTAGSTNSMVELLSVSGTVSIPGGVTIDNHTGNGIYIHDSPNLAFSAGSTTMSNVTNHGIYVGDCTGGTGAFAFGVTTLTDCGINAVRVENNDAAVLTFENLDIGGSQEVGLYADTSGTLNFTGNAPVIDMVGDIALAVIGTALQSNGVDGGVFASITCEDTLGARTEATIDLYECPSDFTVTGMTTIYNPNPMGIEVKRSPSRNFDFGVTRMGDMNLPGGSETHGIFLQYNNGSNFTFSDLDLQTHGAGFYAYDSGILTVDGAPANIRADGDSALRLESVTIGAPGITFDDLSSLNNANQTAINLRQVDGSPIIHTNPASQIVSSRNSCINLEQTNLDFTYTGSIDATTATNDYVIYVESTYGGTYTFSGPLNSAGYGIYISGPSLATRGTFIFSGGKKTLTSDKSGLVEIQGFSSDAYFHFRDGCLDLTLDNATNRIAFNARGQSSSPFNIEVSGAGHSIETLGNGNGIALSDVRVIDDGTSANDFQFDSFNINVGTGFFKQGLYFENVGAASGNPTFRIGAGTAFSDEIVATDAEHAVFIGSTTISGEILPVIRATGGATAVEVDNCQGNTINFFGAILNGASFNRSTNDALVITNNTGGNYVFSGTVSSYTTGAGNDGVFCDSNDAATTTSFNAPLTINTVAGTGLYANQGGSLVAVSGGSITADGKEAVHITSTECDVILDSVSTTATNGSANYGIYLVNAPGPSGQFTVQGDGGTAHFYTPAGNPTYPLNRNGSGGTITGTLQDAVYLENADNVTLRQMDLQNAGGRAVNISQGSANLVVSGCEITGNSGGGIVSNDMTGTCRIDEATRIFSSSGGPGIGILGVNSADLNLLVDKCLFEHITGSDPATHFAHNSSVARMEVDIRSSYFQHSTNAAVFLECGDGSGSMDPNIDLRAKVGYGNTDYANFFDCGYFDRLNNIRLYTQEPGARLRAAFANNKIDRSNYDGLGAVIDIVNDRGDLICLVDNNSFHGNVSASGILEFIEYTVNTISATDINSLEVYNNMVQESFGMDTNFMTVRQASSSNSEMDISIEDNTVGSVDAVYSGIIIDAAADIGDTALARIEVSGNTLYTTDFPCYNAAVYNNGTHYVLLSGNAFRNSSGGLYSDEISYLDNSTDAMFTANITSNTLNSGSGTIQANIAPGGNISGFSQASKADMASQNGVHTANILEINAPAQYGLSTPDAPNHPILFP